MRERIDFTPDFGAKANNSSIIKVIGVGGGGGNAVKHMYSEGIVGVDFLICNTDRQVLEANQVPSKLVLGDSGLGAGAKPEVARQFALNSRDKIIEFIGENTKMLFITAGMGKGTGTGAAPVIAQIAQEMGILTIGVVTYPFKFEGKVRARYAEEGIDELRKYVDSLIVVKNQNILKHYHEEFMDTAFSFADDVLKNAVKCIAELITVNAEQNIDFHDIETVMKNSGPAMLGLATASGENRIDKVVEEALSCPLLDETLITNAQNFLFFISYGKEAPLKISELEELTDRFESYKSSSSDLIWGRAIDESLGDAIKLSVIITNFIPEEEVKEIPLIEIETEPEKVDKKLIGAKIIEVSVGELPKQEEILIKDRDNNAHMILKPEVNNSNSLTNKDKDNDVSEKVVETRQLFNDQPEQAPSHEPKVEKEEPRIFRIDDVIPPKGREVNKGSSNLWDKEDDLSDDFNRLKGGSGTPSHIRQNASEVGPRVISGFSDEKFEDNNAFAKLTETPAIIRQRARDHEDLKNKDLRNNYPELELEDDAKALLSGIPD